MKKEIRLEVFDHYVQCTSPDGMRWRHRCATFADAQQMREAVVSAHPDVLITIQLQRRWETPLDAEVEDSIP